MLKTLPAAPLIFGAIVVALLAGVTGWMVRGRTAQGPDRTAVQNAEQADALSPPTTDDKQPGSRSRTSIANGPSPLARNAMAVMAANEDKVAKVVEAGRNRLQSRYQKEPVDGAWASSKQKALANANESPMLAQSNAKPLSFAAQCRTTVCLIAADFPSADASDDWFTLYTMLAGQEMSHAAMERSTNPDGTVHLQIYGLARGKQL